MGLISISFQSGRVWHFEVNDIENALSFYETGWIEIITDDNNTYTFNNSNISYIHTKKGK